MNIGVKFLPEILFFDKPESLDKSEQNVKNEIWRRGNYDKEIS